MNNQNPLVSKLSALNNLSVAYKILIPIMLATMLTIYYGGKVTYSRQREVIKKISTSKIQKVLDAVAEKSATSVVDLELEKLNEYANEIKLNEEVLDAAFYDGNEKLLTEQKESKKGGETTVVKDIQKDGVIVGKVKAVISKESISDKVQPIKNLTLLTILATLLLIFAVFWLIFKAFIQTPINNINSAIKLLEKGDLTVSLESGGRGEIGEISSNLNKMIQRYNELVGSIMRNSSLLASASEEFSATSKNNVKGASEQTARVEQAYESIQIVKESIDSVFNNSSAMRAGAKETMQAVSVGQEVIMKTVENMDNTSKAVISAGEKINKLGESSKQISSITAVIREITNKTNLLALNAAIEAARAGEHGLGFAVVADEVRKLAERTAKATKEIEVTIQNIQESTEAVVGLMEKTTSEVGESVGLVQSAGVALSQISGKIGAVSKEINSIADSIAIQKTTAEGIVKDIESVSNVAQEFTVTAMQASKASHELSKMATELEDIVHNFKTKKK